MPLLSLEELAREIDIPVSIIRELIDDNIIIPHGGRARIGEPRFSFRAVPHIRKQVKLHLESR